MTGAGLMLAGLVIDLAVGWPRGLYALVGHPVTWIGRLISRLDDWLNIEGTTDRDRRIAGLAAALLVIAVTAIIGLVLQSLLPSGWKGLLIGGCLAWPLIAARSLRDHVVAVSRPLRGGDLAGARNAVAMIVGRDPDRLDEAGIARATIESLSENASDGVVAPLFWGAVFGLPGIAAYKAINTLDSMIGHRTPRHEAFGWASARIDDLANLIPARLTGLLIAAVSPAPRAALDCMWREARFHRSPNAGWPEAAMAAALGVRLSGPRLYHDRVANEPWINGAARDPGADDITRALEICRNALALTAILLLLLWLI
ncbi:adenosylcobinamide-phosphate synthase CbiB [Frigidibacter sp. RF13]|uniref:adenosylcobinamide-phosphate synthase CbiB n=1 Tax=Frigidibacter sp. RF13 TaxID=2997340 RepID=UPI00226F58CE|nr:adenosylcobinamide-phosphate synthase CbiB [Frigidibacter sp. RF13]MCY1126624.1 adenosylcobinamide-phosphate synthase CbiB [Frigidibacter sp. RF13]